MSDDEFLNELQIKVFEAQKVNRNGPITGWFAESIKLSITDLDRLIALARIGASVMPRPNAPVDDGERVRAAKIEAFDEALSIAEGSYSYGEQQNEIIAGIRAALAAINGEK